MLNEIRKANWLDIYTTHGEYIVPQEYIKSVAELTEADLAPFIEGKLVSLRRVVGYCVRLSSPGYLDCTEWYGVFDTYQEAQDHLNDLYPND